MSSSYILPVIFCVLAHEVWQLFMPEQTQDEPIAIEICIEEWELPCVEYEYITYKEQECQ